MKHGSILMIFNHKTTRDQLLNPKNHRFPPSQSKMKNHKAHTPGTSPSPLKNTDPNV